MFDDNKVDRRTFLGGALSAGTIIAVAGCSQFENGDSSDEDSSDEEDEDEEDEEADTEATAAGSDLTIGDTVNGEIREGSPTDPIRNELAVPYTLAVTEERRVTVAQESDAIDTYLVVTDESGDEVARDDDGGEGVLNSRLTTTLSPGETYTVWAGAFSSSETGRFTLSVSAAGGGSEDTEDGDGTDGTDGPIRGAGPISVGETVTGEIREGSPTDPVRDELAVPYTLTVGREQTVEIAQSSDDIDTYLVVTDESGTEVARDDDGGEFLNSRLTVTLTPGVTYTIWAGAFSSEETGVFTLSVQET